MAYGQKNYLEIQGINGKFRIDQIGCFLTAFSNLMKRFGKDINPVALNKYFRDKGIYIDVDDGIRDDLGWGSIAAYDGRVTITGTGKGLPPHANSIAKFQYKSAAGFNTHFCLVSDITNGVVYIIDSWDGVRKPASTYGPILEWAAYKYEKPAAPKPATPKPSKPSVPKADQVAVQAGWGISHALKYRGYPQAEYTSEKKWNWVAKLNGKPNWQNFPLKAGQVIVLPRYTAPKPVVKPAPKPEAKPTPAPGPQLPADQILITIQDGWGISHALKAAGYPQEAYSDPAEWERTSKLNGYETTTVFSLKPGNVIKVYKNPLPKVAPEPKPEPVAPAPVIVPPKLDWRDTFDASVTGRYTSTASVVIKDLDGLQRDLNLPKGRSFDVGGTVEKDGEKYYIHAHHVQQGLWYGVPDDVVEKDDTDDNDFLNELVGESKEFVRNQHTSLRQKLIAIIASLQGIFTKFYSKK